MKTVKEIIDEAYLKANNEFNRLYTDCPVPATVTYGCDQFKAYLMDMLSINQLLTK